MTSWLVAKPEVDEAVSGEQFTVAWARLSIGTVEILSGINIHHRFAPHMHEVAAIGLVDAGKPRVRYRGATSAASTGSLIAISAGEMHTGEPAGDDRWWSYRMIYPSRGLVNEAVGGRPDADESFLFAEPFIADADARARFASAYGALLDSGCQLGAEEHLLALLQTLVSRHASAPVARSPRGRRGSRAVSLAKDYLDAHFGKQVCLSALARECGVSPFHLIRLFRHEYGVPPRAYLKQLRVSRARDMLQRGDTLSHVAYACGFSDQSHLTRTFKSMVGVPPGTYQRAVCSYSVA